MLALDRNIINNQFSDNKNTGRFLFWYVLLDQYASWSLKFFQLSIARSLKRKNAVLSRQYVFTKGMYVTLKATLADGKFDNLESLKQSIDEIIKDYSGLNAEIQKMVINHPDLAPAQLKISVDITYKTLDALYDVLRLLKRSTILVEKETSQLAKDAAKYSASSLQKIGYGD